MRNWNNEIKIIGFSCNMSYYILQLQYDSKYPAQRFIKIL